MNSLFCRITIAMLLFNASCMKSEVEPLQKIAASNVSTTTIISFSGYNWKVKNSLTTKIGPGPNFWSRRNVWVDAQGHLHLRLTKRNNKWYCAEVQTVDSFSMGTWQWKIEGAVDMLDKNVVLGLFNYSGNDGFDEMDIEFARWGNASNPNLNYTVWPAQTGFTNFSYTKNFTLNGTYTTHRFIRSSNAVVFQSMNGFYDDDTNLFATATCTSPPKSVSLLKMPAFINLWMFQGKIPSNAQSVEIVVHEFRYIP